MYNVGIYIRLSREDDDKHMKVRVLQIKRVYYFSMLKRII